MRGNAASDADDLDVRNRAKLLEEILQSSVAQHHRVPAAHDYVADLGMLAQILKSRLVLIERNLLRIAHLATSCAEPAIRGADRTHEKQRAVRIPVCNVRHRRVAVLIE